jgi:hypothetical protein
MGEWFSRSGTTQLTTGNSMNKISAIIAGAALVLALNATNALAADKEDDNR